MQGSVFLSRNTVLQIIKSVFLNIYNLFIYLVIVDFIAHTRLQMESTKLSN